MDQLKDYARVFIHGLESSAHGTKGNYFRERFPGMIIEDFRGPLHERMLRLEEILRNRDNLLIVGSSYGGLMAAIFALTHPDRVGKLVLLAPALGLKEFRSYLGRSLDIPVIVYHGREDDVVPLEPARDIAEKIFTNLEYHAIEDNHPLEANFKLLDWDRLLCYE